MFFSNSDCRKFCMTSEIFSADSDRAKCDTECSMCCTIRGGGGAEKNNDFKIGPKHAEAEER